MTEHKLLELAAKAAGYSIEQHVNYKHSPHLMFALNGKNWNPLTDDGDAFRLIVKLNLLIMPYPIDGAVRVTRLDQPDTIEHFGDDHYAATRRAIVRAAAEIGKEMP